jgi:hypothetical protein
LVSGPAQYVAAGAGAAAPSASPTPTTSPAHRHTLTIVDTTPAAIEKLLRGHT